MSQWEPPRYDPNAHQRRLDDGVPPQGYPPQPQPQTWPPQQHYQQFPPQPGQYPPLYPPPQRYPAPRGPQRRRKGNGGKIVGGVVGGIVALVILGAALSSHGSTPPLPSATGAPLATSAPADASAPAQPATQAAAAPSTVTYVVTGSPADVTYGPSGSDSTGSVPMRKTAAIPGNPPGYYAIDAQLNGSGTVSCEILVGGKVVSKATASGGYEIASCEIVQDPLTGNWDDANS